MTTPDHRPPEEVAERLAQLEAAIADTGWVPPAWRLTPSEARLLNILTIRREVTKQSIHTIMFGDAVDGGPDIKILDVWIHRIRRGLAGTGIRIETLWGRGWVLAPEGRARLAAIKMAAIEKARYGICPRCRSRRVFDRRTFPLCECGELVVFLDQEAAA